MEQSPKKILIEPKFQEPSQPGQREVIHLKSDALCKPHELIKINRSDLVDKFSRKIGHLNRTLTHKSMCQAYNQALIDAEFLLMAAQKDLSKT